MKCQHTNVYIPILGLRAEQAVIILVILVTGIVHLHISLEILIQHLDVAFRFNI